MDINMIFIKLILDLIIIYKGRNCGSVFQIFIKKDNFLIYFNLFNS